MCLKAETDHKEGQPQQCTNQRARGSSTETQDSTGDKSTTGLTTLTTDARNKWEVPFRRAETALNKKRCSEVCMQ